MSIVPQINDRNLSNIPPLTDLHLHTAWTDFDHAEQLKRSLPEQHEMIRKFLSAYANAGIYLARDASGCDDAIYKKLYPNATSAAISATPLSLFTNAGMISGENCNDPVFIHKVLSSSSGWIKIMLTGGVGTPKEKSLLPTMPRIFFIELVKKAHTAGKRVMVHCYGGMSLDWCIEAGVQTIEHGIYMTREQAAGMAEKHIALVPTIAIYRLLANEPDVPGVPTSIRDMISENAKAAADSHIKVLGYALEEGVLIGYGTDFFSRIEFADHAHDELLALMDCGLSFEQAIACGTVNALKILGTS